MANPLRRSSVCLRQTQRCATSPFYWLRQKGEQGQYVKRHVWTICLEIAAPRPDNRPAMEKRYIKTYGCQMNAPARRRRAKGKI